MKFSISSLLVLGLTVSSCVFASPLAARNAERSLLSNTHQLVERSVKYPVKPNDALVAKIMTSVKTDLYAKVFGSITGDFCEQTGASLKVKAVMFGGLIKVGDAHIKTIQSSAIRNLKATFDAELRAHVQASVYDKLQVSLKKNLGTIILDKAKFLSILTKLETEAKAVIKVELPKIGVSLNAKAKAQIDAAINDVQVNIPLIAQITVSVGVNAKTTIDTTIKASLKACAKLNAKASAEAILKSL
ncbi:hypothetical protein EDC94DRAFT_556279 [Helicostylum pulchrum]|uniref:Uncharacterized protein n=1 Tax=Helicostylum pulchrum TaxID=562976 RepID=A0ABP9YH66_9FUNG|nr:hypothetical protein EDC94DRAFT_556279 [Helicostylum pulchrum]